MIKDIPPQNKNKPKNVRFHQHCLEDNKVRKRKKSRHIEKEEAKLFLVISLKEMCKRIPEVMHKYVHNNLNQKHFTGQ